ncbi:MAG: hypothetical protein J0H98_08255 [Solirubrobacterales bacterium]|nr:hypothetical protein [Solirubrobacterales bacterium]
MSEDVYARRRAREREYAYWHDRAERLGVDPAPFKTKGEMVESFFTAEGFAAFKEAVVDAEVRAQPCDVCGRGGDREHLRICDGCLEVAATRRELKRQADAMRRHRQAEARAAASRLSPDRRRYLELSGVEPGSADEVFYEAYDEVPS